MGDAVLNFLQAGDWTALDPQYLLIQILIGLGILVIFCHLVMMLFDYLSPRGPQAKASTQGDTGKSKSDTRTGPVSSRKEKGLTNGNGS